VARRRRFIVFFDFLVVVELLARKIRRRMFDIGQSRLNRKRGEKHSSSVVAVRRLFRSPNWSTLSPIPSPPPPPPIPTLSPPLVDSSRCFTSRVCIRSHCQPARRVRRSVSRRKRWTGDMHTNDRESARVRARSYTVPGNSVHTSYERNLSLRVLSFSTRLPRFCSLSSLERHDLLLPPSNVKERERFESRSRVVRRKNRNLSRRITEEWYCALPTKRCTTVQWLCLLRPAVPDVFINRHRCEHFV